MSLNSGKSLVSLLVLLLTIGFLGSDTWSMRGGLNGEDWENRSYDWKLGYVEGYRTGLRLGHLEGCEAYAQAYTPPEPHRFEDDPFLRCSGNPRVYPKMPQSYIQRLDEYYRVFPDDRETEVEKLLRLLASSPEMTAKQMYSELHPDQ